jgi:DNA repair exonuclease SbcCD ATPase subunit
MKLTFNNLTIKNFKNFTAPQVLTFENWGAAQLLMQGRNELEPRLGSNGSGKSTIWGALCWCLYGKTADGLRNPDIKPWTTKGVPEVTLAIRLGDQPHTITRRAVTNGLIINDQEVGSEEAAKLIGLPFEVFTNTILLGQGLPLFFDLPNKDKLQLFSEVLQLERWDDRSAAASTKTSELERLEAEMNGELLATEAGLATARDALAQHEARRSEWETERKERLTAARKELATKRELLTTLKGKLDKAELAYDRAGTEAKALKPTTDKAQKDLFIKQQAYEEARADHTVIERELDRLEVELSELDKAKACPTCGQPIKRNNIATHKGELVKKFDGAEKEAQKTAAKVLSLKSALDEHKKVLATDLGHLQTFEAEAEELLTELNFLRPQVAELRAQVHAKEQNKAENEEEVNPYIEQCQLAKRNLQKLETEHTVLKEDLTKAARQIERTSFWIKGFKDVRLYIVEDVLQELELTTNVILNDLGLVGWQVKYAVEKETKSGTFQRGLTVTILSPANKDMVRWESFSGGEAQRLRIVGALALSEVLLTRAGVEPNLEILDEPTRHLSKEGSRDLCDFLSERAKVLGRQIWLIDHMTRDGRDFAGVVTVVKDAKGSRIEVV